MLTEKQITEIREHLDKAQNPIFFFDNDADGLVSFLLLQRYFGRGRGVAIRGSSSLSKSFFRKVEELNADSIFLLDRSPIDDDFIKMADEANLNIVCIDHHNAPKPNIKDYYNTFYASGKVEPTSYLCQKITDKGEDEWLAAIGCVADGFVPEFLESVKKTYPELISVSRSSDDDFRYSFDVRFNTDFGKIIHLLGYGLLDKTTNVVSMMKFLMKAKGPHDILEENSKTKTFQDRFNFIDKKVKTIVKKAESQLGFEDKILFFTYGGDMSVSQYVSDELVYKHPGLTLIVGFIRGNSAKFSLRGPVDVRQLTLDSIKDLEGASGGGHEYSSGAQITTEQLPKFKENILNGFEKLEKKK